MSPSQPTYQTPDGSPIPTRHEPLVWDQLREFDRWFSEQLEQLEARFADFVTGQSLDATAQGRHRTS